MRLKPSRIVVLTKDVVVLTGRRPRTARRMLQMIKQRFRKKPCEFVTIQEFSAFTGIKEELILEHLLN